MFSMIEVDGDKRTRYQNLLKQAKSLFAGEQDTIANLANGASLLYHLLEEVNWAGFYLRKGNDLVLGPFMGLPACIRIPIGKGVCGTAVEQGVTQLVPNVLSFPGHIACDSATRSEIVIPIVREKEVLGVLDIDSPVPHRFDPYDQQYLEAFVQLLTASSDWTTLH